MSAIISPCGTYRYRLERDLGQPPEDFAWAPTAPRRTGGTVLWIMLNPSTADAHVDDPTIRKVVGFSRLHRFSRAIVVNLFAFRSTDPKACESAMVTDFDAAVGPDNQQHVMEAAIDAEAIVCAWGAAPWAEEQARAVCGWLDDLVHAPEGICLGTTKSGAPKHPLYVPYAQRFVPFHGYTRAGAK